MRRLFVPLFFALLILVFATVGPKTPADDPQQAPEESQAPAAPEAEPPETFVPSEELPADSAISFPVDI